METLYTIKPLVWVESAAPPMICASNMLGTWTVFTGRFGDMQAGDWLYSEDSGTEYRDGRVTGADPIESAKQQCEEHYRSMVEQLLIEVKP